MEGTGVIGIERRIVTVDATDALTIALQAARLAVVKSYERRFRVLSQAA